MKKYQYIIGIDPDLHKSGISCYSIIHKKYAFIKTMSFHELFLFIKKFGAENDDIIFLLEYPKNTNTYHKGGKGAALNVGKNQGAAIIIYEFLIEAGFNVEKLPPIGYSIVFKNADIFRKKVNWHKSTNEDARASCAIVELNKSRYEQN